MNMQVLPTGRTCAPNRVARPVKSLPTKILSKPTASRSTSRFVVRAEDESVESVEEAKFEERLRAMKQGKGETPYGEGKKRAKKDEEKTGVTKTYDFSGETVYYEGPPHRGDLAINIALGATLVWLPLSFAAIGRAAFVNYRFTDKRLSIMSSAPWKNEQVDVAYERVRDVVALGRGIGVWGDMVVTLDNGDKVELRSLDRWKELKAYILERKAALAPTIASDPVGFS